MKEAGLIVFGFLLQKGWDALRDPFWRWRKRRWIRLHTKKLGMRIIAVRGDHR